MLLIFLLLYSGLQLFYGKKQSGKGVEQNPRQQNELEREETKGEVIQKRKCVFPGSTILHNLGLKGFGF